MNVFYLDPDPKTCAEYHADKHVVKMVVEYAQLMSTAHRLLDGNDSVYRPTHPNHPSAIWIRSTKANYEWLFSLWTSLLDEYTYRYGRRHLCEKMYTQLFYPPRNIAEGPLTQPPPAMPDIYKVEGDSIKSYHSYYIGAKSRMLSWRGRPTPHWAG